MDFLKNLDVSPKRVLIIAGAALVGLVLLVFAFQLIASSFRTIAREFGFTTGMATQGYGGEEAMGIAYGSPAADYDYAYGKGMDAAMPELSIRNVATRSSMPVMPPQPSSTGDTAEEFEVTQYDASIETRRLDETCAAVSALKERDDVIFESANAYDRGCNYIFKVKHASADEILGIIRNLNPKELSENTYTIKNQVDDYTNEVEVLTKKRASIDETLSSALIAYNEITRLATNTQNADALAKIIDSKIGIIERLTQERININEQLDRLARAKAEALDRLDYTMFTVSVYENKFVDTEDLKDSWKQVVKSFVRQFNTVLQEVTFGLLVILLLVAQWALYALIALLATKYGWQLAKYIWFR